MTVNILNVLRMSENDKKIQPSRKKWQRTWISNSQTANKYILKHLFSVTRSMEIQIKKKNNEMQHFTIMLAKPFQNAYYPMLIKFGTFRRR